MPLIELTGNQIRSLHKIVSWLGEDEILPIAKDNILDALRKPVENVRDNQTDKLLKIKHFVLKYIDARRNWANSPEGYKELGPGSPTIPGLAEFYLVLDYVDQLLKE